MGRTFGLCGLCGEETFDDIPCANGCESKLRPMTIGTLKALLDDLKRDALCSGRYQAPFTPENYDKRNKSKAFRCMAYNESVRRVNALTEVIEFLKRPARGGAR